jgi:hypothetical protein
MADEKQTPYAGTIDATLAQFPYQYRTLLVQRLADLQEDIEKLRRAGQISDAAIFQSYVSQMKFSLPKSFPTAQSMIILALAVPPRMFHCQYNGQRIAAAMPPNYYEPGLTSKLLVKTIQQEIIGVPGHRPKKFTTTILNSWRCAAGWGAMDGTTFAMWMAWAAS